jgi:hypothetical protein
MTNETLQTLIERRTDVHECINANTHTISLKSRHSNSMYQCEIALPCTDIVVCNLLAEFVEFPTSTMNYPLTRVANTEEYYNWTERMQSALADMRSSRALKVDIEALGPQYKDNKLQLLKFIKNKYQFGLKETKEMIDLYYLTL